MWQFNNEPMGEHWGKRLAAYVVDAVILLVIVLPFYMAFVPIGYNTVLDFNFITIFGIVSLIYFVAFEYAVGCTIGKAAFHLRVYTLRKGYEEPTFFDIFGRNITKINPIILLIDLALKNAIYGDERQKIFDRLADTIVASEAYAYKEIPRAYVPQPIIEEKKREVETIFLKEGAIYVKHCPRCGTPYRLIVRGGELEMLGPWQNRCTWCNTYITPDITPDLMPLTEHTF